MKTDESNSVKIRRVANGWVVEGKTPADVLHVAVTPEGLAEYVRGWASEPAVPLAAAPRLAAGGAKA